MAAKTKDRSARKQTPQCQCHEQIKNILTRLAELEANTPKIVCVMKPASTEHILDACGPIVDYIAQSFRVVKSPPPNRERERIVNKMHRELIAHDVAREIARSLPRKRRKQ
jgi:hypothetical protein